MHIWVDADFMGTKGWWRCTRCGCKVWLLAPAKPGPDKLMDLMTCEQAIEARAATMRDKIDKLLFKNDCDTPEIRKIIGLTNKEQA